MVHLKNLERQEQIKRQHNRQQERINIKAEINETESKKTI